MTKQEAIELRCDYIKKQGVCPDDAHLLAEIQITHEGTYDDNATRDDTESEKISRETTR
jgi:hypothetical protein